MAGDIGHGRGDVDDVYHHGLSEHAAPEQLLPLPRLLVWDELRESVEGHSTRQKVESAVTRIEQRIASADIRLEALRLEVGSVEKVGRSSSAARRQVEAAEKVLSLLRFQRASLLALLS